MTDVHFRPSTELVGQGAAIQTNTLGSGPIDRAVVLDRPVVIEEHNAGAEMAAFERGRMQGEMEAIRRLEQEQNAMVLKQFPAEPVAVIERPDVVEINRLTWAQRASWLLGEAAGIAYIVLAIVWIIKYNFDFGWSNSSNGDANSDLNMLNTGLFCMVLGEFFLSQALTLYRVMPLRTPVFLNKIAYTFNYLAAMTLFSLGLAAVVKTYPGTTYWGVDDWCYALGFAIVGLHMIYSLIVTWTAPRHVDYENWAEVNNKLTFNRSPEQARDRSFGNEVGRTVYTPAPIFPSITGHATTANANDNVTVPNAPHGAPRWSEHPQNHQEDFFLVPRAKWAVVGFFTIGAAILMKLASVENNLASNRSMWSQFGHDAGRADPLNQTGREAAIFGSMGLLFLASIAAIAYTAMPPRTTLVKPNGFIPADGRRASVSHNAETRIGHDNFGPNAV